MKRFYLLFLIFTVFLSCSLVKPKVIPDANLAAAVQEQLDLDPNEPISEEDLRELEYLMVVGRKIKKLNGLEKAVNLRTLWLERIDIRDFSTIADLTELEKL
ncbi:hypothetical protein F4X90_13925, partial [Candidatus Poribacteria bacterium]|nr:hypothetical protein [Candidatus Poribacteria bacterium]